MNELECGACGTTVPVGGCSCAASWPRPVRCWSAWRRCSRWRRRQRFVGFAYLLDRDGGA